MTNNPAKDSPAAEREYVTSREECERNIKGVCEGCGGALSAIETVDNSGRPTFWQGCEHCSCFRSGVETKYFKVARKLVENRELVPYSHMCRIEYENTPERLDYYFDSQTAGLSHLIKRIHTLLTTSEAAAVHQVAADTPAPVDETIACPFCGEADFDLVGLKSHLLKDCETFDATENLRRL